MTNLTEKYLACMNFDHYGGVNHINEEEWRALEQIRKTLGLPFPMEVMRRIDIDRNGATWFYDYPYLILPPEKWRLFLCDCAERVLLAFEKEHPGDERPRKAIEVARRYARDEATDEEIEEAKEEAYKSSIEVTEKQISEPKWRGKHSTWNAAGAAGGAADSPMYSVIYDVITHAGYASGDIDEELKWQIERLCAYVGGEAS